MNPRVKKVTPEPGYKLRLVFTNGEEKVFAARHLLNKGVSRQLRDESLFRSVRPWFGTIRWSTGQDFCPDSLYEDSVPAKSELALRESPSPYRIRRAKTGNSKPRKK